MKVIIDTDPGHDDALAIMFALKSKKLDIQAITTVAGNSTIENTTRNASYILKLLGRTDIPVYSGSPRPLKRKLIQAVVHGKTGLAGVDVKLQPCLSGNAVEKILQLVKENPGKITVIALGPLTNIATAILRDPKTMAKVQQIVIMGGAIAVPGNKNRVAEFNIFVDPEAADVVFKFPVKKVLVPLDACNEITMSLKEFSKIREVKLRSAVLKMMQAYIANLSKRGFGKGALLYDPLAVYCALAPSACVKKPMDIAVETKGELTRGMTVMERRQGKAKSNVNVVTKIDSKKFKKDFIRALS